MRGPGGAAGCPSGAQEETPLGDTPDGRGYVCIDLQSDNLSSEVDVSTRLEVEMMARDGSVDVDDVGIRLVEVQDDLWDRQAAHVKQSCVRINERVRTLDFENVQEVPGRVCLLYEDSEVQQLQHRGGEPAD